MSSFDPTLQARLDAFIDFKVKHPRLEEMDQDLSAFPKGAVSTGSKTRIERAVTRDLVGDQVKTVKTLKCTFPDIVEIEAKRFLESGVKLVECPNCASMRSLSPRNGVLR